MEKQHPLSSHVNKIHCGAFDISTRGEIRNEKKDYVELNDGSKVYGENISWKSGAIVKDQIKIDEQKFAIKETRGYFSNGIYYGRINGGFAKRIVYGKLNVYYTEERVSTTNSKGMSRSQLVCRHYVQKGDHGELKVIGNQSDIKAFVKDCPEAYAMIDKKDKEIRRAIKQDASYLNRIFTVYNNCQ